MDTFFKIVGFLLTIGILVTIHEWGHFYVARLCNVKILRFSLGFGKPIFSWHGEKDNTLYTISWIPLGGFVQMLGETTDKQDYIHPRDRRRTFKNAKAWQRFLIAAAGPVVNLIFSVLAFSALYIYGVKGMPPYVAHVDETSIAAEAGFQRNDIIRSINGQTIRLGEDAMLAWVGAPHEIVAVEIERAGEWKTLLLDLSNLRAGDELRMNQALGLHILGEWLPLRISAVRENSPAAMMDLRAGDEILKINGQTVDLLTLNLPNPGSAIELEISRGSQKLTINGSMGKQKNGSPFLGVVWEHPSHWIATEKYPFTTALKRGIERVAYYTEVTYKIFGRMLAGKASLENLGGPLTIGDISGRSLQYGWDVFLNFLGVVSLSLAAINLLPIPALDGGHMMFYTIEILRRRALSDRTMKIFTYVGVSVLYAFMIFVLFHDYKKYFGSWTYEFFRNLF